MQNCHVRLAIASVVILLLNACESKRFSQDEDYNSIVNDSSSLYVSPIESSPLPPPEDTTAETKTGSAPMIHREVVFAPTRASIVGRWKNQNESGCSVLISGVPTLDLYKASTSNCTQKELSHVNSWDLRGEEIFLYTVGGKVVARLKQSNDHLLNGVFTKSGSSLAFSR